MAKVEIEIDDHIYDWLVETGQRVVKYGMAHPPQRILTGVGTVHQLVGHSTNGLVIEPIPDYSIPFPDWVPEWANEVTISQNCEVKLHDEAHFIRDMTWWIGTNRSLSLTNNGFPTTWVPAMPNGDWTKAKWRRKKK